MIVHLPNLLLFGSNIDEVIRSVLKIFFFQDKISQVQKRIKTQV